MLAITILPGLAKREQAKTPIFQSFPGRGLTAYFTTYCLKFHLLVCTPLELAVILHGPRGRRSPTSLWKELIHLCGAPVSAAAARVTVPPLCGSNRACTNESHRTVENKESVFKW